MQATDQPSGVRELVVPRNGTSVSIDQFHPQSTTNRPRMTCRISHDVRSIDLRFEARGARHVRCVNTHPNSPVYEDSCMEFFVQPTPAGYFNFEWNCGGAMLLTYVRDPQRLAGGQLADATPLTDAQLAGLRIETSIRGPLKEEIAGPIDWWLAATIPLAIFEPFTGRLPDLGRPGANGKPPAIWRANFQACAEACSQPFWATWSPIGSELNFHQPARFGRLLFS